MTYVKINPIEVQCPFCGAGNQIYRAPNLTALCVFAGICQNCKNGIVTIVQQDMKP